MGAAVIVMLLYAVTPAEAVTPPIIGVSGGVLEAVRCPEAAMVVEECERLPDASETEAVRFARVLAQIGRSTTTLPVRFPTAVRSRAEVLAQLRQRAYDWHRRLDELDGHVEMVVRGTWPDADVLAPDEEPTGSAYLRRRAAVVHAHEDLIEELGELAVPWCREVRQLSSAHGARLACLVPRDATSKLRRTLDEWQQRAPGRRVQVSGPWPPFSFVTEPERGHS